MQLLPRPNGRSHSSAQFPKPVIPTSARPTRSIFSNALEQSGHEHERVIIFIDGANLFYAAMQLGLEVDYTKLLQCLTQGRSLIRAYFYTGVDPTNDRQKGFLTWMRRNGYRVVAKELVQHSDGSKKANFDIEMAIDMITLANHCDRLILLSGNGDLAYAVDKAANLGVQIELVSLPSMLSDSLRDVADSFIDLTSLQSEIQKPSLSKIHPVSA